MLTIYFDGTDNALKGFVAKLNQIFINKLDNGHLFFFFKILYNLYSSSIFLGHLSMLVHHKMFECHHI